MAIISRFHNYPSARPRNLPWADGQQAKAAILRETASYTTILHEKSAQTQTLCFKACAAPRKNE